MPGMGHMKLTRRTTTRLILGLCAAVGVLMIGLNATSGRGVRSEQSLNLGPASPPAARLLARPLIEPAPPAGLAAAQLMGGSGASPGPVPAAVSASGTSYPNSTARASLASSAGSLTSSSSPPAV